MTERWKSSNYQDGLIRVEVCPGTWLTEALWNDAHNDHATRLDLHQQAAHGFGIVSGLEVTETDPPSRYVMVHPGVAVDPWGRVIRVGTRNAEQCRVPVQLVGDGWVHVLLEWGSKSSPNSEKKKNYVRHFEYGDYTGGDRPAVEPQLELARILVGREYRDRPIRNAADPFRPVVNEIDLRCRITPGAGLRGAMGIGHVYHQPEEGDSHCNRNAAGLALLAHRCRQESRHQVRYNPAVELNGDEQECTLLYVTGSMISLDEAQLRRLHGHLQRGGVVLAEGSSQNFLSAAATLAARLSLSLQPVPPRHPLLTAHHVFFEPPEGTGGHFQIGTDRDGTGVMLISSREYGALWAPEKRIDRGLIRDTLDFGVNIAVYSALMRSLAQLRLNAPR